MSKKLLNQTSRSYLLFALFTLVISAPIFYFVTQRLYLKEADDTLKLHKKEFLKYTASQLKNTDIFSWNRFNRNVSIKEATGTARDSLYYIQHYDTLDAEIEPYRELKFSFLIDAKPFVYTERISLVETEDLLKNIAILFLSIIAIFLIGLFFITKSLSKRLWKPFYNTVSQIENFEIDKSQQPVFEKTNIEEFERLNVSIKKLIEKNTIIYKSQREFIENAAHELQTPLAVFQVKIDALMQREDIVPGQAEIITSLNENVGRLNRLNKNLLLLSKIEHDSYETKKTLSLNNEIDKNLEFFAEQARAKNIKIIIAVDHNFEINSNPTLAEIFFSNLFLNAIRHNTEGGTISITTNGSTLYFANTGKNRALNTDKLFSRFSKENTSEKGTGLGLSIIKKIADINDWKISYEFLDNSHVFSIRF